MPNKSNINKAKNANPDYFRHVPRGVEKEFDDAYRNFWAKRGVDISKSNTKILAEEWKLSDPFQCDPWTLKKAIEYGRSYRKDG